MWYVVLLPLSSFFLPFADQLFLSRAAKFLGAGYKVGRVDQTETALG